MTGRPRCLTCGKAYGRLATHTSSIWCPGAAASSPPMAAPYRGNGVVTKEFYSPDDAGWKAGARSLGPDGETGRTLFRSVATPNVYYTPYKPFCTLRCGFAFGRALAAKGHRL